MGGFGASQNLYYEHSYNGFEIVQNNIEPDFSVPFEILKNQEYYLLIASYNKDYMVSNFEAILHLMVDFFENIEHAKIAAQYLTGEIIPTQHEILKAIEKLENFNGFDESIHSYSIDYNGEVCIVENFPWTKIGQSILYNNRTEILEKFIIEKVQLVENVDIKNSP